MYLLQNLIIPFSLVWIVQAVQIYVITTEYVSSNATCEKDNLTLHPCVRLANLPRELPLDYESTNISINITFLPGDYYIFDFFSFQFHDVNFYLTSWQNQSQVKIICESGDFSLEHSDSKTISIRNVEFYNCGNAAPIISIQNVTELKMQYVNCTNSSEGFLTVHEVAENVNIGHCIFQRSTNNIAVNISSSLTRSIHICNTTFSNNSFGSLMLQIAYTSVSFDHCIFEHNKANENSTGAAIDAKGSLVPNRFEVCRLSINHCLFINNTADKGGVVAITECRTNIWHSRFTNNSACKKGGAIKLEYYIYIREYWLYHYRPNIYIANCIFIYNHAQHGGVIYICIN